MAFIRWNTMAIGRDGGRSRFCPVGMSRRGWHRGQQTEKVFPRQALVATTDEWIESL
jgi:hypothetical protein